MAVVPLQDYPTGSAEFDQQYKVLLDALQAAWATGSSDQLFAAIDAMGQMGDIATSLMQKPLPDAPGTFGPDFKLPTG